MTHITDHFVEIQRRVHLALERAGRSSDDVKIVAVSKGQPAAAIESARGAGATDFGENYVQEALDKIAALGSTGLVWHFIGRIQSNKTRLIAERFDWVHTVDREQIAARLSAQRPAGLPPLNVLIQLNLAGEPQKGGIGSSDLLPLAKTISELPNVALRGLMTIPPAGLTEAACREHFAAVAAKAKRLREHGLDTDTLSMGMSSDFELAIECGATCVRIGTAVFGPRRAA